MPTRVPGFTLIELVVVLLLLAIVLGMVGVNLARDDSGRLRDEAARLDVSIKAARQEAILQGRIFAVSLRHDGYDFLGLNDQGKLAALVQDDVLRGYALPAGVRIDAVSIDGNAAGEPAVIVLPPGGELPPFTIGLAAGAARWQLTGEANGSLQSARGPDDGRGDR